MDLLPMAAILAREGVLSEARSALPDAPVVPDRTARTHAVRPVRPARTGGPVPVGRPRRPVAARPRRALASALTRAACAVDPA